MGKTLYSLSFGRAEFGFNKIAQPAQAHEKTLGEQIA
jgi:hypothetical protein